MLDASSVTEIDRPSFLLMTSRGPARLSGEAGKIILSDGLFEHSAAAAALLARSILPSSVYEYIQNCALYDSYCSHCYRCYLEMVVAGQTLGRFQVANSSDSESLSIIEGAAGVTVSCQGNVTPPPDTAHKVGIATVSIQAHWRAACGDVPLRP